MNDCELDIDPESPALEYRIIEIGGEWILAPANPEFPRTPAENELLLDVQQVLPAYDGGRFRIPDETRERLDAEPGDAVSILTVVQVHGSVFIDSVSEALKPMIDAVHSAVTSMIDEFESAFVDSDEDESPTDRGDRLPDSIREARDRREQQRENADQQLGSDRFAGKGERG